MLTALVVDDEDVCRTAAATALRGAGWRVLTADGPVQARVLHDLHSPDLLVTDVWMERGDGLTLLAQLGRRETAVLCRTVEREARAGRVDQDALAQLTSR